MSQKDFKKTKKVDFCVPNDFWRSLFSVFSVKSKNYKNTLLRPNRERQNQEFPRFFMPDRAIVTRRYDFVKIVENNFVMQYCFDSFSENQLFLQN